MVYIKLFNTEQEKQACTDKYEYLSYTIESNKVNIMNLPFFCKLTLNNDEVVEIEGSGELTNAMLGEYEITTISAEIGNLCTSIGDYAFSNMEGTIPLLTKVDISNSVTSIGEYAFIFGGELTSITIGNSVTSIGDWAFFYCTSLSSITIPDSVTTIGESAFSSCGLTSITIGNSVTSIGEYAFDACESLSSITSLATTAPTIQSCTFDSVKTNGTLYVPQGSSGYDAWLTALGSGWTKVEQ